MDGMIDLFWFGSNHYLENPSAGGIIELSALVKEQSHIHEGEEIHIISVKPEKHFNFDPISNEMIRLWRWIEENFWLNRKSICKESHDMQRLWPGSTDMALKWKNLMVVKCILTFLFNDKHVHACDNKIKDYHRKSPISSHLHRHDSNIVSNATK